MFDTDFKQEFGDDLSIDVNEEKAKWLRVFHAYIVDKKMEPLDAVEKIRKDYQGSGIGDQVSGGGDHTRNPTPDPRPLTPDIDPSDSLFAGMGKSIVQGSTSFPKTFWGAGAVMEDIIKSIPQAIPLAAFTQFIPEDFFKRRYEDVKGIEERFQAKGEGYKKYVNGAIQTMSGMLSQYVGTAGLGTLPSMSAGAGIDKYLEARKEGYSIPRSFAAGGVTTTTEYITEKTPLEILGRPGLKFVDRLMKGLIADIPGEVEATLVEMTAVDQAILGKKRTWGELGRALLDTVITAAMTTFGATGVTHPFTRGATQQTPGDQQTQQAPEIKQPAKEEVPGVKPEEYAVTPKTKSESKATLSDEEMNVVREKLKSPEVVSFVETYRGYLEKEPEYVLENHKEVFFKEFGLEGKDGAVVKTPIEEIVIIPEHYEKLEKHADVSRRKYVKYIKPTLENPNEIREFEDEHIYIKAFKDGKVKLHTTIVVVKKDGTFYATNVPLSNVNKWEKAIKKGNLLYSVAQKPAKEVAPSSPGNNIISSPSESVKFAPATLTPEQLSLVSNMEEELAAGEAPQVLRKETDEGIEYKRTQSTNPEYFVKLHDYYNGISKAYVRNIFKKAKNNETLTPKQTEVLQSLLHSKTETIESQKYYVREQLPKVTVGELDLNVGDKFKINGEEFLVSEIDKEGNYTIKDGITYEVDVFGKIPQPDQGSIEKAGQPQEAELPNIQIMPSLKGLVGTGKLSIEDALEIEDVAKQNNWSNDTVKQFHKSAVEGLGIQNKDTASLEQMLVTAKVKEAVYKKNAEQYKQELAETTSQIERLSKLLKIEGGAPDKYETAANDFIKNLGDLKNLKPEEIIQKVQEEFALNLNRLDTGMDVKTIIAAAVKTINEAEDISRETVSHEQTINEALKELPGIYSKVIGMKRGKTLTRPQQLAARMMGSALFETFNKTKMLGMANPADQKLYQKAQTQLVELGQYWSKVLASSSEIGRALEAQKIIEKVGADIPATEEFQKVLEMLSGQKEISPEQFYALTNALRNPEQVAEMARELAKPVTRRIQDGFLEAWINGLLSNPQTHATNVLSNLYTTFASIPERYLAAKTHYGSAPGVVDGEAKAMLYGMQMGFRDAVNAARLAWTNETGRFGKDAMKVDNTRQKAISADNINRILGRFGVDPMNQTLSNAVDYVGKIWRLPTRALTTADEFFKMINYRMELQALAYRQAAMEGLTGDKAGVRIAELIQKPTTEMRARAMAHANVQTFTGEMGPVATAISGITERVPMAKVIVPFVRTPSNIFTYTFERTPLLAYARNQVRADIKAGGAARDMALGKMAFGGMIASMAATLAASGFITGSGPEDRDLKKMMRDNGWQPNSIRIGDTYYSYKRMDPVGMIIGMVADATEIMGSLDDYSAGKLAMSIVLSMEHNLLDRLYFDGIMNILDAIQDPGKQWHDYFKKQAGSLMPAIAGDIARGFDPVVHDTKSIVDTMRSRIPGFSITAPAQRNIFGEKRMMDGRACA